MKIIYTIKNMIVHHKELRKIKRSNLKVRNVTELTSNSLKNNNIKYLALDFDGVLAAHGSNKILPEVADWLKKFGCDYDYNNIFILSNKPTLIRKNYFEKNFPGIRMIYGTRKKPYPDGLEYIQKITNCKPFELALVDDRILTGCLACVMAKSQAILVHKPYMNMKSNFLIEFCFLSLRFIERLIF